MTLDRAEIPSTSRRRLLQLFGIAGTAAATVASPAIAFAKPKHAHKGVVVYRLSTRGTSRCKACARHHKRFAFLTHALADAHRAHPGCNCPITTQRLLPRTVKQLFPKTGSGVADLAKERRA